MADWQAVAAAGRPRFVNEPELRQAKRRIVPFRSAPIESIIIISIGIVRSEFYYFLLSSLKLTTWETVIYLIYPLSDYNQQLSQKLNLDTYYKNQ